MVIINMASYYDHVGTIKYNNNNNNTSVVCSSICKMLNVADTGNDLKP